MSFNFSDTRVTALSPGAKEIQVKAVKLTFADFTTGGAAAVKAVLPADASIIGFRLWVKTQLSGNGITAATLSIGTSGTPTQFINATGNAFNAANAYAFIGTESNIFQDLSLPQTSDISLLFTGTATTGNPTAGEMYVLIEYVR
jgi:hypothetical protein